MLERGHHTSPKMTANANNCPVSVIVTCSFGIGNLKTLLFGRLLSGLSFSISPSPVAASSRASQKTVPYRGGIVGLVEPHQRAYRPRGSPAPLTLARLGFLMRVMATVGGSFRALGNYRLIRTVRDEKLI